MCSYGLDTVEPAEDIVPRVVDGYITSSGNSILCVDNKALLACMLFSLYSTVQKGNIPPCELLIIVREETNGGIKDFDVSKLKSQVVYIFDKSGEGLDCVATNASTIYYFEDITIGKSAHASRPEEGINALLVFNDFMNRLDLGRVNEFTTFNIGLLQGGTSTNTVIENLAFSGDLLSLYKDAFLYYKTKIEEVFTDVTKKRQVNENINWTPYLMDL